MLLGTVHCGMIKPQARGIEKQQALQKPIQLPLQNVPLTSHPHSANLINRASMTTQITSTCQAGQTCQKTPMHLA
jgi:hypothetical protein